MTKILTYGRTDIHDFFEISGMFAPSYRGWQHHPALVFLIENDTFVVRSIDSPADLARLADETPVMQQWQGRFESHWFKYSVGQARPYLPGVREQAPSVIGHGGPSRG